MNKPLIRIADSQFAHSGQGSYGAGDLKIPPSYFEWVRSNEQINDIIVITEGHAHLVDQYPEKIKILLLIESPMINPAIYEQLRDESFASKFSYVLTFSKDLVELNPSKFIYTYFGGCWLFSKEQLIYPKTKNISIISSAKTATPNHLLRHTVIAQLASYIDGIYGRGYKEIHSKLEGLRDYRYHIVIENDSCRGMTSEKAIDAFRSGCILFYCGDSNIFEYFNRKGVFMFETVEELSELITTPSMMENYYNENIAAVKENYEKAELFIIPEDLIWSTFLSKIYKESANAK